MNETQIKDKFPFLSMITHNGETYVGIIQNSDDKILSFYDFGSLRTAELKSAFLECGSTWWWESNRKLPINIFLVKEMQLFRDCLRTYHKKDVNIKFGPCVSLSDISQKRIKRRQITLLKNVD